jgi:hypothetical protein
MPGRSLADWLEYIERIHPQSIQLGLERVVKVRDALGKSTSAVLLAVAGTNGKGSTPGTRSACIPLRIFCATTNAFTLAGRQSVTIAYAQRSNQSSVPGETLP